MVEENFDKLMEKFPKMALQLPHFEKKKKETFTSLKISPKELDLIYFYGIGVGEVFLELKSWLEEKEERRLIVIEDDFDEIASFLHGDTASYILENKQIILVEPCDIDPVIIEHPKVKLDIFCHPLKDGPFFEELKEKILKQALLSHANHLDRLHGYQIFENFCRNVKKIPGSFFANRLASSFKDVPLIICGAGPTLQEAIPFLKKWENKALIIGGGSTIAALTSQGVFPHFGMAVDPNLEEYERLKNSFGFEIPFLYSTRLHPLTMQTCNGPFGYMRSGIGGILELWMEEALGLTGPLIGESLDQESISVTTICLAWAHLLGCNPIFFTGVDLAYTGKKRYASGVELVPHRLQGEIGADRQLEKRDGRGENVESAVRWVMEGACISRFAERHPDVQFYRFSKLGLSIEHVDYIDFENAEKLLIDRGDLKKVVFEKLKHAFITQDAEKIIDEKMDELHLSLTRVVGYLEILAGEKKGSSILAESDLKEELSYKILFYDAETVLKRESSGSIWKPFLMLAKNYQTVINLSFGFIA